MNSVSAHRPVLPVSFASRVGHEVIWVAIAGLFCLVEGAVFITEHIPFGHARRRLPPTAATTAPAFPRESLSTSSIG